MGIIIGAALLIWLVIALRHFELLRQSRNLLLAIERLLDQRLPKP